MHSLSAITRPGPPRQQRLTMHRADDCGSPRGAATSEAFDAEIKADRQLAGQIGVQGVPHFVFSGTHAVPPRNHGRLPCRVAGCLGRAADRACSGKSEAPGKETLADGPGDRTGRWREVYRRCQRTRSRAVRVRRPASSSPCGRRCTLRPSYSPAGVPVPQIPCGGGRASRRRSRRGSRRGRG